MNNASRDYDVRRKYPRRKPMHPTISTNRPIHIAVRITRPSQVEKVMRVDFEFVLQLLVLVFQKETEFFNPSFRLRARKRRSRNPSDFHSAGAADCATQGVHRISSISGVTFGKY